MNTVKALVHIAHLSPAAAWLCVTAAAAAMDGCLSSAKLIGCEVRPPPPPFPPGRTAHGGAPPPPHSSTHKHEICKTLKTQTHVLAHPHVFHTA